jgi:PEP-CTERM motif
MQNFIRRTKPFISTLICMVGIFMAQTAAAGPISGFGAPSSHPDLAGGSVIDFSANAAGEAAMTFAYMDVSMTGNHVLRITDSFDGLFNVTGNCMALTSNDLTEEITFSFSSPVNAFGFNFGGADQEWHLIAYSAGNTILDELAISPFGSSNNGEWFGIAAPGIASARLSNTAFDVGSNTGTPDYVVIDSLTYANAVPEPSALLLMGLGMAGLGLPHLGLGRRRRFGNRA